MREACGTSEIEEAARLLGRLVACPSVNPAGRTPEPPFGEARLAELLREILTEWGAEVSVREVAPGRPNLVARFTFHPGRLAGRGAKPGQSIMLEAHGDTVQVEDMTVAPFEPAVRDGRLYGRGACDTKGAMAAMLLGLRAVLDEGGGPPATVYFVSTCDEEMGASGARALVGGDEDGGFQVDAAVVGEPTDLAVVTAHKGAIRWRIGTEGVAAHSSEPSMGVNAISQMRKVLEFIEGPVEKALREKRHPLLGEPTISVGTIRGGSQVNVVPSRCEIEVDRRLVPGETREEATAEISRGLDSLAEGDERFRYSLEETQWYPPFDEAADGPLVTMVADACRKVTGEARLAVVPYSTNAGFFGEAGIPCVVFGPGSREQAHTADEYVELEQVVKAAAVYAEIIRTFGEA